MNLIKIVCSLHYHNIFRRFALFYIPFYHFIIFEFWVWILYFEFNILESSFHSCLEHYVCWNIKNIVGLIWSCFYNKFEFFKIFRLLIIWLSVKSSPEIVFRSFNPRKICHNYTATLFNVFFALKNQFF